MERLKIDTGYDTNPAIQTDYMYVTVYSNPLALYTLWEGERGKGEQNQSMSVNWRFNAASFNNYGGRCQLPGDRDVEKKYRMSIKKKLLEDIPIMCSKSSSNIFY